MDECRSIEALKEALDSSGIVSKISSSISSFVNIAKVGGCSGEEIRKLLNNIISKELRRDMSPAKRQEKSRKSASCSRTTLISVNMAELYSRYIDPVTMFNESEDNLSHMSDFGYPHSYSRSFSRSKKDSFSLEKTVKPGPGRYEPKLIRTSSPMHSLSKSKKTGLEFKMPYSPGPGAYKPLCKIMSKRA